MPDFLLEVGCEEIPARMIDAASQELRERVTTLLSRERLAGSDVHSFDAPRRLTVMASGISPEDRIIIAPPDGIADGDRVRVAGAKGKPATVSEKQDVRG